MTKDEAEKAAATFEFPPFKAEAELLPIGWALRVWNRTKEAPQTRVFTSPEQWQAFYDIWKRLPQ